MGVQSSETTRFGSSMYLNPIADFLPLLFPGASGASEAFPYLQRELGYVDLIARALSLF